MVGTCKWDVVGVDVWYDNHREVWDFDLQRGRAGGVEVLRKSRGELVISKHYMWGRELH